MLEDISIGRVVLRVVAVALCVAAAMACYALVSGSVDDTDWKVIGTSLLVALASATAGAGLGARPERPLLGTLTVGATLVAFVLVEIGIWGEVSGEVFWRVTASSGILALEGAH